MANQNPFGAGQLPFGLPGMMQLDPRTLALAQQQLQLQQQQQLQTQSSAPSYAQLDPAAQQGISTSMPTSILSKAAKRSLDDASQSGDTKKTVKSEQADSNDNNSQSGSRDGSPGPADESAIDKRKRNCLASARFRQKKKAEMQMLEEIAAAKSEECEKLQQSVKLLQAEVTYLKQLMFMNALANAQNPAMLQALATQNPLMAAQAAQLTAATGPGASQATMATGPRLPQAFQFAGVPGMAPMPMGDLSAQIGMQQAAMAAMGPMHDATSLVSGSGMAQYTNASNAPKQ